MKKDFLLESFEEFRISNLKKIKGGEVNGWSQNGALSYVDQWVSWPPPGHQECNVLISSHDAPNWIDEQVGTD